MTTFLFLCIVGGTYSIRTTQVGHALVCNNYDGQYLKMYCDGARAVVFNQAAARVVAHANAVAYVHAVNAAGNDAARQQHAANQQAVVDANTALINAHNVVIAARSTHKRADAEVERGKKRACIGSCGSSCASCAGCKADTNTA